MRACPILLCLATRTAPKGVAACCQTHAAYPAPTTGEAWAHRWQCPWPSTVTFEMPDPDQRSAQVRLLKTVFQRTRVGQDVVLKAQDLPTAGTYQVNVLHRTGVRLLTLRHPEPFERLGLSPQSSVEEVLTTLARRLAVTVRDYDLQVVSGLLYGFPIHAAEFYAQDLASRAGSPDPDAAVPSPRDARQLPHGDGVQPRYRYHYVVPPGAPVSPREQDLRTAARDTYDDFVKNFKVSQDPHGRGTLKALQRWRNLK